MILLGSFLTFADNEPPLLYATTNFEEVPEGRLVTHSDGYWYIFDDTGELRAIPDDEAGAVQVSSEPTSES